MILVVKEFIFDAKPPIIRMPSQRPINFFPGAFGGLHFCVGPKRAFDATGIIVGTNVENLVKSWAPPQ